MDRIYTETRTDPEGDSCFRWIKINAALLMATISSSETFAKRRAIFLSVRKTVNIQGYSKLRPGANQNARKLPSTDLVNTKFNYLKSLLFGSAANVIAGLALTNASYESLCHVQETQREIVQCSSSASSSKIQSIRRIFF